jgi:hypothetical protein
MKTGGKQRFFITTVVTASNPNCLTLFGENCIIGRMFSYYERRIIKQFLNKHAYGISYFTAMPSAKLRS